MTTTSADYERQLDEAIAEHYADPLGYVMLAFPWGDPQTILANYKEPRAWQCEFFEWLGDEITARRFDGVTPVKPIRAAVSSGHGVGKGALTGMLVDFLMNTRPDAKGTVTANTSTQLDDKTWASILTWHALSITKHRFEANTQILYRRGMRSSWRVTPQTCAPENSEAFAGQHSERSTSFYINDEDSNVPEVIHEVQEGGLVLGEAMQFLFGNPTRRSGAFYDATFGERRNRYKVWVIDSRSVKEISQGALDQIEEWRQDYGDDSDFFRVRVQGLPPNASDAQFIDHARVESARRRTVGELPDTPLVAGCDLAWGGNDNNVVRFRRGRDARSIPPIVIPGRLTADPSVLTNRLADVLSGEYDGRRVAMLFLDSAGIAGPIAARLRELGHRNVQEVNFGADSPHEKRRYYRDHMWAELKDWLLVGAIDDTTPAARRLAMDLEGPGLRNDSKQRVWLESKEDMRKRGVASPDHGDALALTFAQPVKAAKPKAQLPRSLTPAGSSSWMS